MKKSIGILFVLFLLFTMSACSAKEPAAQKADNQTSSFTTSETQESAKSGTKLPSEEKQTSSEPLTESGENTDSITETVDQPKEEEPMKQAQFYITANSTTFTADFADNDSADAFRELLGEGDLTISMSDYGGFEKVGSIGKSLTRKDTQISTSTGDIMLYQGNQIVIFYGRNSWSYSRLGRIEDASADDLLSAFGSGDSDVTFSLTNPQ